MMLIIENKENTKTKEASEKYALNAMKNIAIRNNKPKKTKTKEEVIILDFEKKDSKYCRMIFKG